MKLANRAYLFTLIMLMLVFAVSAQDHKRSDKDPRNTTSTVGTGGPVGGPTGLFTVYDGQTLRKGEYTLSISQSNYDRDPGDVDITSIPLSFQIGVSDKFEVFFSTEAYRGIKVNSPRNLSGFYLPNTTQPINGANRLAPAIVLAPRGPGANAFINSAVYRPIGMPNAAFPFTGSNAGTYGIQFPFFAGPQFGFPANTNPTYGPPVAGGGAGDLFPGVGSTVGGILPGIVLSTRTLVNAAGAPAGEGPLAFTVAPTYLPDAPFLARTWGVSAFNTMDFGFKWRFNDVDEAIGYGLIAYYRWNMDTASTAGGFNMLQRGAGGGGNKGDIGAILFADARLSKKVNLSANVGYTYTTKAKGTFGGASFVMLDRPDELRGSLGLDFPLNKYFQPILELQTVRYVGGRTPNALERHPVDGIGGFRVYPRRWWGFGVAYRRNFNQQDFDSFDGSAQSTSIVVNCRPGSTTCSPVTLTSSFTGAPPGFRTSSDPHGYIANFWIGRRDKRQGEIVNQAPSVDSVALGDTTITLPCPPGRKSTSGACNDNRTVSVQTSASDPENDVLTYNYTVSGGRIVGQGARVEWDLSTAQPGTYTITTGVDDGCGVCGKTNTQTIKVEECADCILPCSCPSFTLSGPSGITSPGETMTFTASVGGDVTYNWSVSAGTIESGQGTPSITVRTTADMADSNVTATLQIGGTDPACNCPSTLSETAGVAPKPGAEKTDEFGSLPDDEVKARVDNFFIRLNNDPSSKGYIINYGTPAEIRKRKAQINKAITFRKFDASRITFVDGPDNGSGILTKFYIVPSGAVDPTP